MSTVEELRDALAQLTVTVQLMATNIPAAVAAAPPPPATAAAPPVVLSVEQRINSSFGKLVQLSRQDPQYTDKEKGSTQANQGRPYTKATQRRLFGAALVSVPFVTIPGLPVSRQTRAGLIKRQPSSDFLEPPWCQFLLSSSKGCLSPGKPGPAL